MPNFQLAPDVSLFYRDEDCTDPWRPGEAMMMLHGFGEHSQAWNSWMPAFSRRFRVVRPDMRGFGYSTAMPADYTYSIDQIIDDYVRLADHLELERFHLVGAKIGGTLALRFAALYPKRVLSVVGNVSRVSGKTAPGAGRSLEEFGDEGVEGWARASQKWRLGDDASQDLLDGWTKLMKVNALSTMLAFTHSFPPVDIAGDLPKIVAPTLMIVNEGGLFSVDEVRRWQTLIPRSEVLVIPGKSLHVFVTNPDECVQGALEFIDRTSAAKVSRI